MSRSAVSVLSPTLLALGLAACAGAASAQDPYSYRDAGRYAPQAVPYEDSRDPYDDRAGDYDYARVLRVDPVLQPVYRPTPVSSGQCYGEDDYYSQGGYDDGHDDRYDSRYGDDRYGGGDYRDDGGAGTRTGRNVASVIGGIVGAALGSKVGGGSARYATAAVGSMVGGMAGREIYESAQRTRQPPRRTQVTVCDPVRAGDRYGAEAMANEVSAYDVTYEYAGRQYTTRTAYHPGDRLRVRVDVRPE